MWVLFALLIYGQSLDARASAEVRVGLFAEDVTPKVGVPLGGFLDRREGDPWPWARPKPEYPFATWFAPSQGTAHPIRSKAMVLDNGSIKLVFVSLDLVGIDQSLRKDVTRELLPLGFKADHVVISATHTHSGPGTLARQAFWQLTSMDRFQRSIYEQFIWGIVRTVRTAEALAGPATLYATSFEAEDLQVNRRKRGDPVDRSANLLIARSRSGKWLGGIVNFAVHGTALLGDNFHFSSDVPGGIESALERRLVSMNSSAHPRPAILFVNGAEGDVAPAHGGAAGIPTMGALFADQAVRALSHATVVAAAPWSVSVSSATLPIARFNTGACAQGLQKLGQLAASLILNFQLPHSAPLSVLRLGDITMMTVPGEPTSALGFQFKALIGSGARKPWIFGLTNGHLGYFTTPEEYQVSGTEACASFYGEKSTAKLKAKFKRMLK